MSEERDIERFAGDAPALARRVGTGVPGLDAILGGGFPANSINILMGEPGTGKTILAERLIFANARPGKRPILYFATLAEPLDKLLRYLQGFRFYDEATLVESIVYDSIGAELAEGGVAALVPKLRDSIKQHKPQIIVIDSFKALHDLAASTPELRRTLFDVAGVLAAYETTAFLVGEYCDDDIARYPEFAIADGVLALTRDKHGTRDERFLRVLKLRGSSYLEGLHAFRITDGGLEVYPRLVSPELPPSYEQPRERVPTGIAGLDAIFGGGPYRGTTSLVFGPTGSGKTTLGLQFALEGIRRGERSLYVYFEENPTQLAAQIANLGHDAAELQRQGLVLLYKSPVELQIDSIISGMFKAMSEPHRYRVVLDGVGDLLLAASDPVRLHSYLYALTQQLAARGVASLFSYENRHWQGAERLSVLCDNIVQLGLDLDTGARRTLRVVKARGIAHDLREHELTIGPTGITVE